MFRAAYRLSSGALTVFAASGLHTHVVAGHSQVCYKVASCWLFLLSHTTMHGFMNIKFKKVLKCCDGGWAVSIILCLTNEIFWEINVAMLR
jgi:hypothetical protein